jgi:hypothetical protein
MNEPTQGPWKYGEFPLSDSGNIYIWNQDETILIAEVSADDADSEEAKANAALIAVAPEMLELLEVAGSQLAYAAGPRSFSDLQQRIGELIRKAKDVSQFVQE